MLGTELVFLGLIFGSIGIGYFMYGKKQSDPIIRYTGFMLIFFPYFFSSITWLVITGIILLFVPAIAKRF